MDNITCTATTAKGLRCASQPSSPNGFCLLHDPEEKAAKSAGRRQERKDKLTRWEIARRLGKMDEPSRMAASLYMCSRGWALRPSPLAELIDCLNSAELEELAKFVTRQNPPASTENNSPD